MCIFMLVRQMDKTDEPGIEEEGVKYLQLDC